MGTSRILRKKIRDRAFALATFWMGYVAHEGVKLSLRGASPRVRYRLFKDYEADDVRLCRALLEPGDRVLELGTAIGFLAIYCLRYLGVERFAGVEANSGLREIMADNFRVNDVPMPRLIHAAVGPVRGTARFHVSRDYFSSSMRGDSASGVTIEVPQMTIPDVLAELDFTPNVLIMDIEGTEVDLPVPDLCRFDKILAEFHGRKVGQDRVDALLQQLKEAGFQVVAQQGPSLALSRVSTGRPGT